MPVLDPHKFASPFAGAGKAKTPLSEAYNRGDIPCPGRGAAVHPNLLTLNVQSQKNLNQQFSINQQLHAQSCVFPPKFIPKFVFFLLLELFEWLQTIVPGDGTHFTADSTPAPPPPHRAPLLPHVASLVDPRPGAVVRPFAPVVLRGPAGNHSPRPGRNARRSVTGMQRFIGSELESIWRSIFPMF